MEEEIMYGPRITD